MKQQEKGILVGFQCDLNITGSVLLKADVTERSRLGLLLSFPEKTVPLHHGLDRSMIIGWDGYAAGLWEVVMGEFIDKLLASWQII